jgi:hypothetical protein
MKMTFLNSAALLLAGLVTTTGSCQAQGTFDFDLWEQQPGGVMFYGGLGSLTSDASVGQFVINVVFPYDSDSFSPVIATPSGTLSFSLGSGVPVYIPFGTFGDFMYGTQYVGFFSSSPAVLSDLLAGLGELRLTSDSPAILLSGSLVLVPEPSSCVLFLCGLVFAFWRTRGGT